MDFLFSSSLVCEWLLSSTLNRYLMLKNYTRVEVFWAFWMIISYIMLFKHNKINQYHQSLYFLGCISPYLFCYFYQEPYWSFFTSYLSTYYTFLCDSQDYLTFYSLFYWHLSSIGYTFYYLSQLSAFLRSFSSSILLAKNSCTGGLQNLPCTQIRYIFNPVFLFCSSLQWILASALTKPALTNIFSISSCSKQQTQTPSCLTQKFSLSLRLPLLDMFTWPKSYRPQSRKKKQEPGFIHFATLLITFWCSSGTIADKTNIIEMRSGLISKGISSLTTSQTLTVRRYWYYGWSCISFSISLIAWAEMSQPWYLKQGYSRRRGNRVLPTPQPSYKYVQISLSSQCFYLKYLIYLISLSRQLRSLKKLHLWLEQKLSHTFAAFSFAYQYFFSGRTFTSLSIFYLASSIIQGVSSQRTTACLGRPFWFSSTSPRSSNQSFCLLLSIINNTSPSDPLLIILPITHPPPVPMPVMQPDPQFTDLVNKSHILKRTPDLQVPLVPKHPMFKHHLMTTLSLSSMIHFLIYPLDTLKTRIIARNQVLDIARFNMNKVESLSLYLGIVRGYGSILVSNLIHLTVGRENLVLAAGLEGLTKTWIDMTKISKQMGNNSIDLQLIKTTFLPCAFYGVLRDILFRTSYVQISSYLHNRDMANSKFFDQRKRVNNIFTAAIVATLVSQPLDVIFTKTASQKVFHYVKTMEIPRQILKEEGGNKLLLSGLWVRLVYNLLSTMILANAYEPFINASLQAF